MSRVGKKPIPITTGVEVKMDNRKVVVKGPRGQLNWGLADGMEVLIEDGLLHVKRNGDSASLRALHGLTRAELQNLVTGVTSGYEKVLELTGVGYRAQIQGNMLSLNVGFSHPVTLEMPSDVDVAVEKQTTITVKGIDKRLVTQVAANIKRVRPPDVYKQKGIKYAGETLIKKAGKTGKK